MVYEMDRKITNSSKVSQITQLFQQSTQQITQVTKVTTPDKPENFSKKFNSARAMFEKLGSSEEKEVVVAEKKVSTTTVPKFPKPALPEKPEKKLNGRELIEKQKNWVSHFSVKKSPEKGFGVQPKSPLGSPVKSTLPDVVRREILPDIFSNESCVSVKDLVRKRENSVEFDAATAAGLLSPTKTDISQNLQVEVSEHFTLNNGESNDLLSVQVNDLPTASNDALFNGNVARNDSTDAGASEDIFKVNFKLNHHKGATNGDIGEDGYNKVNTQQREVTLADTQDFASRTIESQVSKEIEETETIHKTDLTKTFTERQTFTKTIFTEVKQEPSHRQMVPDMTKPVPGDFPKVKPVIPEIRQMAPEIRQEVTHPRQMVPEVRQEIPRVRQAAPEVKQVMPDEKHVISEIPTAVAPPTVTKNLKELEKSVEVKIQTTETIKASPPIPPQTLQFNAPPSLPPKKVEMREPPAPLIVQEREKPKIPVPTAPAIEAVTKIDKPEEKQTGNEEESERDYRDPLEELLKKLEESSSVDVEDADLIYPMPPERRDSLKDSQQVSYASIQIKPKDYEENSESTTSESISNNSFASSQVTIIENPGEFKGSEEIEVQFKVNGFDRIRSAEFVDVSGGLTLDESFTGLTESSTDDADQFISSSAFMVESGKEVYFEAGVHYLDDGHYWVEVPGIPNSDEDDDYFDNKIIKKSPMRVRFSVDPMKVYTTHSVDDYDRRNENVDPVAASAEYELEKRVEKMEVFSVELIKGPEGLGLSIIGMGVGADAGLEKLGIFVKTITDGGAAHRDNRIQVNDQIIEVDGKSLVGVTQAYAASVLRNTSGLVKFLVGREKDPENSEVAQLIRQSLQADRERDERRKLLEQPRGPPPPPPPPINDPEVPTLKEKLKEKEIRLKETEVEVEILRRKLDDLQINLKEKENVEVKVKDLESQLEEGNQRLKAALEEVEELRTVVNKPTNTTELEKKYERVKKIVRLLQMREKDMSSRQEVQILKIHERDGQYHDLLRSLKQRVNLLENELSEITRRAGLPPHYLPPFPSIPPAPLPFSLPPPLPPIEIDLSDEENSVKEEFDSIPQHLLLDSSAGKAKADLASRGGLAGRQAPTVTKRPSSRSSNCSLDQEEIKPPSPELLRSVAESSQMLHYPHRYAPNFRTPPISPAKSYTSSPQIEERLFTPYKPLATHSLTNPHFHTTTIPSFDYSQMSPSESMNNSVSGVNVGSNLHSVFNNQSISSSISVMPLPMSVTMQMQGGGGGGGSNNSSPMTNNSSTIIKEKSSRDEESFDSWQSRESESNSSSAVSNVEAFPPPMPEKWMNLSPHEWSNEQVCQWLLFLNLEHLIPPFMDHSITGPRLLQLESKELKSYGVNGDDKLKIKKKIKEMKLRVEKEKKQMEKDRKEREKLMKKEKKIKK